MLPLDKNHCSVLEMINKFDAEVDDAEKLLPALQSALIESRTKDGGLNEQGLEIALWFYQCKDALLPPRSIAKTNTN